MSTIEFDYPYVLLLLIPIVYCLLICKEKLKQHIFVHLHLFIPKKGFFKIDLILKVLIATCLLLALATPVKLNEKSPYNRIGIDIVLALDASGSMNASGYQEGSLKSKFTLVKEVAQAFVNERPSDNTGVVLFGDFAFIASPVTYEKEVVIDMIGYLNQGMAGQNTAIGEAIAAGVRSLKASKALSKVLILLTDGEHNSGSISPKEAVKQAQAENVKVYTIAIGKENDADTALLQTIAKDTGARSFYAKNPEDLKEVYSDIASLERSRIRSARFIDKEHFYELPLSIALALMVWLYMRRNRVWSS